MRESGEGRRTGSRRSSSLRIWLSCVFLGAVVCLSLGAQQPQRFAAVSIRKYQRSPDGRLPPTGIEADPAGLHMYRQNLRGLICYAYSIRNDQIVPPGQPRWTAAEAFTVEASTSTPATDKQLRLMLRRALAERFGLKLSIMTRETPVLAIMIAPGGPKLTPLKLGQAPTSTGAPPPGQSVFRVDSMRQLVMVLNGTGGEFQFGRRFIDETGLTGRYNIWFYVRTTVITNGGRLRGRNDFSGVPAQLKEFGLELKPETVPMAIYSIESAHPPTSN